MEMSQKLEIVAGVDEAGRGPLAGAVFAAAVILNPVKPIAGLADSKKLTAKQREKLFDLIYENALAVSVARAEVDEIDHLNILHATMLAMQRAVAGLSIVPELALIDGNRCPKLTCQAQAIIGGDAIEPAISAASIIAKVARDRDMLTLHQQFPEYNFARHKGYGTAEHLAALEKYGPCALHRRSYAPVAKFITQA